MLPDWQRDTFRAAMDELRERMNEAQRWQVRAQRAFWVFWGGVAAVLIVEALR